MLRQNSRLSRRSDQPLPLAAPVKSAAPKGQEHPVPRNGLEQPETSGTPVADYLADTKFDFAIPVTRRASP